MDKRIGHDVARVLEKGPFITILDDYDFSWTPEEMKTAIYLYNHGATITPMAKELRPKLDVEAGRIETALLIMHLGIQKKLEKRRKAFLI